MRFLRSEDHAPATGDAVPLAVMWSLTQGWYGDRLSPNYRPKSAQQRQQLLADAGLTTSFWQLGGPR